MVKGLGVTPTGARFHKVKVFLRSYGYVLLLALLIVAQIAINWSWLSTNVNVIGWDRPRHLIESLVYSDILEHVNLNSLFAALTYSGYYPPLFHLSMAASYKLFGVSMDAAAMVNTVYLVILLISAYGIGREIGGKGVGLLTAFITSTLPMVLAMSRYTYIEFSLTAMVALSIWLLLLSQGFARKRYSLLFGLSLGLGLLTKWTFALFVFPALIVVILRSGLLSGLRKETGRFSVDQRWLAASSVLGLLLTLVWYLPNAQRVTELPLTHLLLPLSWLLLTGLIYLLRQPSRPSVNLLSGLWLGLVLAGSWYLSRLDFISHTFFIAWGRPQRQTWAFEYYLDRLIHEQFSLLYAVLLVAVSLGLLVVRRKAFRKSQYWRGIWRSDLFLFVLWIVVPYLVFSFRPSSRHSRFIMPILPAAAAIMAYGLSKIRFRAARVLAISMLVILASLQSLVLSFDMLGWIRDAAIVDLPAVGQVHIFANGPQNQLPSSGPTDSRFWIVPAVLEYIVDQRQGSEPIELGLLLNTQQINEQHFQYLIYTDYQGQVRTRELALNLANEPIYPQLFELDYLLLMTNHLQHRIHPDSLEVVEAILNDPPPEFREAFRLAWKYALPDKRVVYLYERRHSSPPEASRTLDEAILARSSFGEVIITFAHEESGDQNRLGEIRVPS